MTTHRAQAPQGGSFYTHPHTGERFWSVTTIIGGGVPKPALVPWASKLVAEHAATSIRKLAHGNDDPMCLHCGTGNLAELVKHLKGLPNAVRDKRASGGSAMHHYIERYVAEEVLGDVPFDDHLVREWAAWEEEYTPTIQQSELTVINRMHGYAGTLDAIALLPGFDNHPWLIDWKTGKAIYSDVGLQMAAYRHAEVILTKDGEELPMPEVAGAAVLRIDPDPDAAEPYEFRKIDTGEEIFASFLAAAQVHSFTKRTDVIGPRIPTGKELADALPEERELYFAMADAVA